MLQKRSSKNNSTKRRHVCPVSVALAVWSVKWTTNIPSSAMPRKTSSTSMRCESSPDAAWGSAATAEPGKGAVVVKMRGRYDTNRRQFTATRAPLWVELGPAFTRRVTRENHVRVFDESRRNMRNWERSHPDNID